MSSSGRGGVSSKPPSSRFTTIYDALPADAQQELVEKHLIPLLNQVEKVRFKKAFAHASELHRRHDGLPGLNLKAKRMEINGLLDELQRDAKRSFVKDRSHKKELLGEAIGSLTDWLNDIWSVVYEHNVNFIHAHKCLMFVAGILDHLASGRSSCRCTFNNMFVTVTIKRKSGKHVKAFNINGAQNIEQVLFFIWRDLFLSMLAAGNEHHISQISDMLEDIEDLMSWTALERILYGGKKCSRASGKDVWRFWQSSGCFCRVLVQAKDMWLIESQHDWWPILLPSVSPDDLGVALSFLAGSHDDCYEVSDTEGYGSESNSDIEDDDGDADYYDDDGESGPQHARHWSSRVSNQMDNFRKHIYTAMMSVFKVAPSQPLYIALCQIWPDRLETDHELRHYLKSIAVSSSETFAAALDIYATEDLPDEIIRILDTHQHLLRPRDASALQNAILTLGQTNTHNARALQVVEKELLDTVRALRAALLVSFSQLELTANKEELQQILKLRSGAAGRQNRVEAWINAVATPGTNGPNPIAFAAMMMGVPLVPGMDPTEDADPLGYLDLDPHDPDLEDLREEFRPRFKQRFEGWTEIAQAITGGAALQQQVYRETLQLMPFLRASDIVDEMVGRLADKPNKHHVCDGLDALSHFVQRQRKKANNARILQRQRDVMRSTSATSSTTLVSTSAMDPTADDVSDIPPPLETPPSTGTSSPEATTSATAPTPSGLPASFFAHIPFAGPSRLGTGGLEDVD
ncbi:hypothetical protein IEO21_03623 [Rhodonia placenta]|uniref:Uncharacterized protein n=1 Tax=Rhodonia placenta TaxID=104341 RepID=A0A8H7P5I4_9APHY|nr:hypothetical protein IEO21_03623 [Postia placenta]